MKLEDIARTAHEVNRAYCQSMCDFSQQPWAEAPDWQRESAVHGVQFHLDNPGADPSASHNEWLKVKLASGWKFGPVKDAEKREHPCMVPYTALPLEQRVKDFLFIAVVHSLAPLQDTFTIGPDGKQR